MAKTTELEDDLKLQNWLSVLTFDAFKYAHVGGRIIIEQTEDGLVLRLIGVDITTDGVNAKFRRYAQKGIDELIAEPA